MLTHTKQAQWRAKRKEYLATARQLLEPYEREKTCPECGKVIPKNRHYCDDCKVEHYRTYQREYKRHMRAQEKEAKENTINNPA